MVDRQALIGGGPIPRAVQRAISHALSDVGPLTFVANSLTYLVERTGRGWVVSGITAHGPVA